MLMILSLLLWHQNHGIQTSRSNGHNTVMTSEHTVTTVVTTDIDAHPFRPIYWPRLAGRNQTTRWGDQGSAA